MATTVVGKIVTLGTLSCRLKEYTSYVWGLRRPNPIESRMEFTQHPRRTVKDSVLLLYDRTIAYDLGGIPSRLTMTSYYACGPCGFYAEVDGSIGDTVVRARAALTGSFQKRDSIEPVIVNKLIFYITYSIDNFSLAVLEVRAVS